MSENKAKPKKGRKDLIEIHLAEYDNVIRQFMHWDTLLWQKSGFFLAIQSAFLIGAFKLVSDFPIGQKLSNSPIFPALIAGIVANMFICIIWLLTSIRNRAYLRIRQKRAIEIERILQTDTGAGSPNSFSHEDHKCLKSGIVSFLEYLIPVTFFFLWASFLYSIFLK